MQDRLRRRVSKSLRRRMHTRDDMQTSYQEGLQNDTQGDLLLSRLFWDNLYKFWYSCNFIYKLSHC